MSQLHQWSSIKKVTDPEQLQQGVEELQKRFQSLDQNVKTKRQKIESRIKNFKDYLLSIANRKR